MPEVDNTIALKTQTPNALNTIGSMLDIVKKGSTLQADIAKSKAEASTAQTQSTFAKYKLKGEYADRGYQIAGGLLQNPAIQKGDQAGSMDALMQAEEKMRAYGIPEDQVRVQMAPLYMLAGHKPEALAQALKDTVTAGINASAQGQAMTPSGPQVSTGQVTQNINTNPLAAGVAQGAPIPGTTAQQQIPPTAPVVNPQTGQPTYYGPQGTGGGSGRPVTALSPSDQVELPLRTQERVAVNAAAAQVPTQHFNNQQIIKLADTAYTGTGASKWASVMGAMGIQNVSGDAASDFQRMQHFMALQAQSNAAAMGAGTDAARSMAEAATNKTNWTEKAVVSTAKVNDALATGVDLFNQGMEKAISKANGNVLAKRDFQNKWAQVFDVRAMQLENALKAGDKAEIGRIVQSVGGPKSAGAKDLANKVRAMDRLVATGG